MYGFLCSDLVFISQDDLIPKSVEYFKSTLKVRHVATPVILNRFSFLHLIIDLYSCVTVLRALFSMATNMRRKNIIQNYVCNTGDP